MDEPTLPARLIEARHTPLFDFRSLPDALAESHRTTVWVELFVQGGSVRYIDLEGASPRDVRLEPGDSAVIVPDVEHHVEPSTDERSSYSSTENPTRPWSPVRWRSTPAAPAPGNTEDAIWKHPRRSSRWSRANTSTSSRTSFSTAPLRLRPRVIDWQAHIGSVTDYWCHVVLYAPDYEIDVIENHRHLHDRDPFTPELFDRWLQIFHDTVDGGWAGPQAERANKRAAGMAWAIAQRFLGKGVWRPAEHR